MDKHPSIFWLGIYGCKAVLFDFLLAYISHFYFCFQVYMTVIVEKYPCLLQRLEMDNTDSYVPLIFSSRDTLQRKLLTTWWRHQMEPFSASLALCAGNSPASGEFPAQRPVTRSFDVFFDLRVNKRLSKQSWGWWFEALSRSLWRHRNENLLTGRTGSCHHNYCNIRCCQWRTSVKMTIFPRQLWDHATIKTICNEVDILAVLCKLFLFGCITMLIRQCCHIDEFLSLFEPPVVIFTASCAVQ